MKSRRVNTFRMRLFRALWGGCQFTQQASDLTSLLMKDNERHPFSQPYKLVNLIDHPIPGFGGTSGPGVNVKVEGLRFVIKIRQAILEDPTEAYLAPSATANTLKRARPHVGETWTAVIPFMERDNALGPTENAMPPAEALHAHT
ncbi:uncharacterized protein [Macrobrachium rosenbergii]|uniref:uncharacterized protein n=1 Tax=Macrobrachium rosenbergii TaxID=79674 RepID=UPI0034D3B4AA